MSKPMVRNELRQDDPFQATAGRSLGWLGRHRLLLAISLLSLVVLVAAGWGVMARRSQRAQEAATALAHAWHILSAGEVGEAQEPPPVNADPSAPPAPPRFPTEAAKYGAAQTALELAAARAEGSSLGRLAALLLADTLEHLDQAAAAETQYRAILASTGPAEMLYVLAADRLAQARERAGDLTGAIAALQPVAGNDALFYADQAQLAQARLHLRQQAPELARPLLDHLELAFPNSAVHDEIAAVRQQLPAVPAVPVQP